MSTPRIGPLGTPIGQGEARETETQAAPKGASTTGPADRIAQHEAPKPLQAKAPQATTAALSEPVWQPGTERRAGFGGERGAWPPRVRRAILLAAENQEIGQQLLDAFNRGVA